MTLLHEVKKHSKKYGRSKFLPYFLFQPYAL